MREMGNADEKNLKAYDISNKSDDCCDCGHIHQENISKACIGMPDEEILYNLADFYKVFADSTRIKMLFVLKQSELCVCDIAQMLNASQSAISHQLRVLKQMKLVKFRREGKTVFYSLSDDHIAGILGQGLDHIME